jgi:hypothetical protein
MIEDTFNTDGGTQYEGKDKMGTTVEEMCGI